MDLEISLVRAFSWSLRDIDETDIESLLGFVFRFGAEKAEPVVYADQVDWL